VEDLFVWNRALRSGKILPKKWQDKMFDSEKPAKPESQQQKDSLPSDKENEHRA
jgi:hypothetical protein